MASLRLISCLDIFGLLVRADEASHWPIFYLPCFRVEDNDGKCWGRLAKAHVFSWVPVPVTHGNPSDRPMQDKNDGSTNKYWSGSAISIPHAVYKTGLLTWPVSFIGTSSPPPFFPIESKQLVSFHIFFFIHSLVLDVSSNQQRNQQFGNWTQQSPAAWSESNISIGWCPSEILYRFPLDFQYLLLIVVENFIVLIISPIFGLSGPLID